MAIVSPSQHGAVLEANMNISPVFTVINGTTAMAVPAPAGRFWRCTISNRRATFFGGSSSEVFAKARADIEAKGGAK